MIISYSKVHGIVNIYLEITVHKILYYNPHLLCILFEDLAPKLTEYYFTKASPALLGRTTILGSASKLTHTSSESSPAVLRILILSVCVVQDRAEARHFKTPALLRSFPLVQAEDYCLDANTNSTCLNKGCECQRGWSLYSSFFLHVQLGAKERHDPIGTKFI